MLKQQKINIADTNMALFGTDIEKNIKKHASDGEPAWANAGKKEGIEVWRVEKFQIKPWPHNQYGTFYSGDSFIVLNTYKVEDAFKYNVHFWLGTFTTIDEAGTAAYKTVELDDHLDGLPVQYREVQGSESEKFLHLFEHFHVLDGGIETGFHHVEPEKYKPRLLQIKGRKNKVVVRQVPPTIESLNQGDVFILDAGFQLYQFVGKQAGIAEKGKATQLARAIDDQREGKVKIHVFTYPDTDDYTKFFWEFLGGKKEIHTAAEGGPDDNLPDKKRLFKLSDETGSLKFTEEPYSVKSLNSKDVYIVDAIDEIFVWIGKSATKNESRSGVQLAQAYLNDQLNRDKTIPIVRVLEGGENQEFYAHLGN